MNSRFIKKLDYLDLSAFVYPTTFEIRKGVTVIETIKIPSRLKKFYKDAARRDLVILDYLDRLAEDSPVNSDSDFLKKFAILLNRELKGILSLEELEENRIKILGIVLCPVEVGNRKHLKVVIGKVSRLLPFNMDTSLKLLLPIFMIAAVKRNAKNCCGGEKKSR